MEEAFRRGIELFNGREFFVCHEVLEDIWRPEGGPRRFFLQAIIHLAVGFHHWQHGNLRGAERQLRKGLKKLAGYLPCSEGLDTAALYHAALACLERVRAGEPAGDYPVISFSAQMPWPAPGSRSDPRS